MGVGHSDADEYTENGLGTVVGIGAEMLTPENVEFCEFLRKRLEARFDRPSDFAREIRE